jgi:hypothetical protein
MAAYKIVVRNSRIQMVQVMISDTAGEPPQDTRKLIEGTAPKSRGDKVPTRVALPIHTLKLMLNVEQPSVDDMGERERSQHDEKKGLPANSEQKTGDYEGQRDIGSENTSTIGPADFPPDNSVADQCDEKRSNQEHDQRISIKAILQPTSSRGLQKFPLSHHPDIPLAALVKVARGAVMPGIAGAPAVIWCDRQQACYSTPEIVGFLRVKKGAVTAFKLSGTNEEDRSVNRSSRESFSWLNRSHGCPKSGASRPCGSCCRHFGCRSAVAVSPG